MEFLINGAIRNQKMVENEMSDLLKSNKKIQLLFWDMNSSDLDVNIMLIKN